MKKRKKANHLERIVKHPRTRKAIKAMIYKDLVISLATYGLVFHQTPIPIPQPTQEINSQNYPIIREEDYLQDFFNERNKERAI